MDSLLLKGLECAYNQDYECSKKYYNQIIEKAPHSPIGYFFKGALLQLYMLDFATDSLEKDFYRLMGEACKRAKSNLEKNPKDTVALFMMGSIFMFKTIYEGWHQRYWKAVGYGLKGKYWFDKVLKIKPDLYDAFLLKGAYNYLAGRINKYLLGIIPFGNIEKGIEELKLVTKKGRYFNITAANALAWVLIKEKKISEAEKTIKELIEKYPNGRAFKWRLGELLLEKKEWKKALNFYEKFLIEIQKEQPNSYNNIAEIKLNIASCYFHIGEKKKASSLVEEILRNSNKIQRGIGYKDIIKEAKKLKKKIGTL